MCNNLKGKVKSLSACPPFLFPSDVFLRSAICCVHPHPSTINDRDQQTERAASKALWSKRQEKLDLYRLFILKWQEVKGELLLICASK
jgi:hypothetical protein